MSARVRLTRPAYPVLVFDGECGFCTTWVDRLEEWLPRFPTAVPWQWLDLDAFGLTREDVETYAWFLTSRHQFAGHLAFSALLRGQPDLGLRFLGRLLALPPLSWAAAVGYRLISRFRHLLPGGTPACRLDPDGR